MQLISIITAVLALAAGTFAQPIEGIEQRRVAGTWTVQNFKRVCNTADTSCTFTYGINKNNGSAVTKCNYKITGSPASHASYQNIKCGTTFTISSGWNSQGFTTLSVVSGNQIIYPAYADMELEGNNVVKPNKSYTPQALP